MSAETRPFSEAVVPFLEGSEDLYTGTRRGAIVNRTLSGIVEGSSLGREFASYFSVTDVWDFNQDKIVIEKIDVEAHRTFASIYSDYDEDAQSLIRLMKHGFEFHLVPNG